MSDPVSAIVEVLVQHGPDADRHGLWCKCGWGRMYSMDEIGTALPAVALTRHVAEVIYHVD